MSQNVNDNKYGAGKETQDIDTKNVEVDEKNDIDESLHHILIKPIVKTDVNIEGLEIECTPTLDKASAEIPILTDV